MRVVDGAASRYGGFFGPPVERPCAREPGGGPQDPPFRNSVRVTNLRNGKTVVVRINDRGPHRQHRVIDLAQGAATELGMIRDGEVPVQLEVLP